MKRRRQIKRHSSTTLKLENKIRALFKKANHTEDSTFRVDHRYIRLHKQFDAAMNRYRKALK